MIQIKPKRIKFKSIHDRINLILISDVHHAQSASDEGLLIRELRETAKLPNRLILGIGDELDSISRADKRHKPEDLKEKFLKKENYHRLIDAEIEDYARILSSFTRPEEWLGHLSGNHPEIMSEYGVDPVERLCILLQHIYLGYSAFIPIMIEFVNKRCVSCMILAHHGFGGTNARKEGSSLNAYIDHAMRYEDWDIAIYGHRHDRWIKTIPRIKPQGGGIKKNLAWVRAVDRKIIQAGTYLRTLSHSKYPTYAEKAGYPPRPLGCVKVSVGLERIKENGKDNLNLKFYEQTE